MKNSLVSSGGLVPEVGITGPQPSPRHVVQQCSAVYEYDACTCPVCGDKGPSLWAEVGSWTYFRCEHCGLIYLERLPSAAELESYYNTVFQVDRKRQDRRMEKQCGPMLRILEELLPGKGKLLEVGCSYGHFLERARAAGWMVEGVEISREAAQWGQEELGLCVHGGTLEEVSSRLETPYEAVAIFHVLEHALEPERLISEARALLRAGGVLIIRTPNASSWAARRCGETWEWLTPPAHIHLFSPNSLRRLLEQAGLRVESISTRRGDAHNTAFEFARAMSKRLLGNKEGCLPAGTPPLSRRGWYRRIESLSDLIYQPLEFLEDFYFGSRQLHPELLVTARAT